jgi:predicted kinase
MSVLLHLNGAPGVGKSSCAERLVASRPGWLNCDIDILRTLIGGWQDNFAGAGARMRPMARDMMAAQLASGHGVVLPQLIMEDRELAQFKSLATVCGVPYIHVFLEASDAELAMRWQRRSAGNSWVATSQRILRELGGTDAVLMAGGLARELAVVDRAVFIRSEEGRIDAAVAEIAHLLPWPMS